MSTDLSTRDSNNSIVPSGKYSDEDFFSVSGSGYLPTIRLFAGTSEAVKSEKIRMNCYGLATSKDDIVDLGKEVDVLVIDWRPRAMDLSDRSNIRSSFQPKSDLFQEIKTRSAIKNSSCMFGPEYLLWVPAKKEFAAFFMGSATARNESRKMHQYLGQPATLKSRLIKSNDYTWQGPLITQCSAVFDMPDMEKLESVRQDFLNPKEQTGAETVEGNVATVER